MLSHTLVGVIFGVSLVVTLGVAWIARSVGSASSGGAKDEQFQGFQRTYLAVYLLATMADWMQGPYVYALYESYGFSMVDNATLFTAGFGSSALFGTFIGSLADKLGRRKFAALYCVLYMVSCLTKHVNSFYWLMLGRITGGIATSLLFSVFDAWMVSEHNSRGFDSELLGSTFSLAVFANSFVAIAAGEVGQVLADWKPLTPLFGDVNAWGNCAPFDASILLLVACLAAMMATWHENFGHAEEKKEEAVLDGLQSAAKILVQQPQLLCLGLVSAFFEASMFVFVFMWTPALTVEGEPKPPYGHIFATFMVLTMLGSQIFSMASEVMAIESIGRLAVAVSALCNFVPVMIEDPTIRFLAFLVFELCIGVYFPMMGTLKGKMVPEANRSAMYNLFRVPLNTIVVVELVMHFDMQSAFTLNAFLLVAAVVLQTKLIGYLNGGSQYKSVSSAAARADFEFGLDDAVEMGMTVDSQGAGAAVIGSGLH